MMVMSTFYAACGTPFVVDDEDNFVVSQYNWWLLKDKHRRYVHGKIKNSNRNAENVLLHRIISGAKAGYVVDHINNNGLDNRRSNLRLCTVSENAANAKLSVRNTTGVKGPSISVQQGRVYWEANVMKNGKKYRVLRASRLEAEAWLEETRKRVHGEFARFA